MPTERRIQEAMTLPDMVYELRALLEYHAAEPEKVRTLAGDAVQVMEYNGWQNPPNDDLPKDQREYLEYCRREFDFGRVPVSFDEYKINQGMD